MDPSPNSDSDAPFDGYVIPVQIHANTCKYMQIHANTSFPFKRSPQIALHDFCTDVWQAMGPPKFVDVLFAKFEFPRLRTYRFPKLVYSQIIQVMDDYFR